jgi:peptidoglycan hydrolase-like protein with peptidoglycan-binding domain
MTKSLAILSGLALGGAMIVNAPFAWSQTGSGTAPSTGQSKGSESQVQKPTDPSTSGGQRSGSKDPGMSRGEDTGMQRGAESGKAGAQHMSNDKVKAIQEALKSKGFDPGTPDGVIGPKTSQAIRDFQKSENLPVTGRIDDKTAKALGVEAAGMSGSKSPSMGRSPSGSEPSGRQQESGKPEGSSEEKTGAREPAKGLK